MNSVSDLKQKLIDYLVDQLETAEPPKEVLATSKDVLKLFMDEIDPDTDGLGVQDQKLARYLGRAAGTA